MRIPILMPKANYEMEIGIVNAWRKTAGEGVVEGEVVADIETEKAVIELDSPASGILVEIVHGPGVEVPVLAPIAWIETGG